MEVAGANRRWRLPFRCRGSRRESAVAQLSTLGHKTRMADSTSSFRDKVETFLPARERVGRQAVGAAQFGHGRAGLPLLEEGEFLFGGKAAAPSAFGWRIWVHLHKVKYAFQIVQISTGADQAYPSKEGCGSFKNL